MRTTAVLIFVAAGISGCETMEFVQNADEFRAHAPAVERLEIQRSFRTVSEVLKKKSAECLDVTVTGQSTQYSGGFATRHNYKTRFRPTFKASAKKAELHVQSSIASGGPYKVPEGGMYFLVVDAHSIGNGKTRVDIYSVGTYNKPATESVKKWVNGTGTACPELT